MKQLINYTLHLADTTLILAQRNSEWCAHGPILEQDIAITNISLDLLGQSRNFYQYAAQLINQSTTQEVSEDSLAYLRTERKYKNLLITELPNGDWAQTILRQFFFSVYQYGLYEQLLVSGDVQLAAIAEKSLKEITYHIKWSSEWVIRLGDGTEESHIRMEKAIKTLWQYTGEFFIPADFENEIFNIDPESLKNNWQVKVEKVFAEATLQLPVNTFMHTGGKTGNHTEHLGYILAGNAAFATHLSKCRMVKNMHEKAKILSLLEEVCDPEVPVLSILDLGIVRDVKINGDETEIIITPTYSGCPAMDAISVDIRLKLLEHGYKKIKISSILSPAWTTDWMTETGKRKLKTYGIAPPQYSKSEIGNIECPQCHSLNTKLLSQFGSTACKALHQCNDCKEPFDYFKCH